jgi:hypothetical protein
MPRHLTAYFIEIFPLSVTRILQLSRALRGKPSPPPGWTIFAGVLFASSGWVNVLLWVVTGRQFGFTASSVRTLSDNEAGGDPNEAALARGDQTGRKPTTELYYNHLRESSVGSEFIPSLPSFPPPRPSGPSDTTMSSFRTSLQTGYDSLGAYKPGAYDYGDQTRH